MKQLNLIPRKNLECGGSLQNSRKEKRVLSKNRPIHLVLKARKRTLFENRDFINRTLKRQVRTFNHKILSWSVQKNHIHILLRIYDRKSYVRFIRAFTGLIARKLGRGIWKFRPYSRVLSWGREIENVSNYIFRNEMEVYKIWPYQPREKSFSSR